MSVSYTESEVRRMEAEVYRYEAAFKQQVAAAFDELHRVDVFHYSNLTKARRVINQVRNCRHLSTDLTDPALLDASNVDSQITHPASFYNSLLWTFKSSIRQASAMC
jgi:hypothetical protein